MLRLRSGRVIRVDPLTVGVDGAERPAWADPTLVGEVRRGDEVIVNVEALDLGLGSGGFDIVCANLTRGLGAPREDGAHVMKLNYTPVQHAVEPVEPPLDGDEGGGDPRPRNRPPVAVCLLHGQLPALAWAARAERPRLRIGYVQAAGGALPGFLSRVALELRHRETLCGHITAGPAYGGEHEAVTLAGALHAAADRLGWEAVVVAPGPGILGSNSALGHGGMAGLEALHTALALGLPAGLCPRASSADPRPRHRGLSHHTRTVLDLCLSPVTVVVPEGDEELADEVARAGGARHAVVAHPADLDGYVRSGLPLQTMGRSIEEEPRFFACALAAGVELARAAA